MELREYVRGALPQGASLRRDRGDALYITDAPRLGWTGPLSGFSVEICGPLARLSPLAGTMERCDYAPDRLALELSGMKGASQEALELFTECLKCAEAPDRGAYARCDRKLRQAAAKALRAGGGEGLYYCALALAEAARRLSDRRRAASRTLQNNRRNRGTN